MIFLQKKPKTSFYLSLYKYDRDYSRWRTIENQYSITNLVYSGKLLRNNCLNENVYKNMDLIGNYLIIFGR